MMPGSARFPITLLTGFLGSGKTTILRRVLGATAEPGVAVIINEFGEVGLDHHLVRHVGESVTLVGNGCLCCARREDLVRVLRELLELHDGGKLQLTHVILETTGLADPAPILFTVINDPLLQHRCRISRVLVTVDTVHGELQLERHPEARKQLAAADHVILTKTDLNPHTEGLVQRIRELNPAARVHRDLDTPALRDLLLDRNDDKVWRALLEMNEAVPEFTGGSAHGANTESLSLVLDSPMDWNVFAVWLTMLLHAHGQEVLRVKGILDVGDGAVLINGVQHVIHPPEHLPEWPTQDRRSRIVFIVRGLEHERLLRSLETFQARFGSS